MKDLELLSPAGNLDILMSTVSEGADAVYFGGEKFGARAFAMNFSMEDANKGIFYCHANDAKAYLTINTLLKNVEMERELYDYALEYVNAGIDAFIVQDFGVFNFLKKHFPKTDLHASTQMTITGEKGARFLKEAGASRIVTARELSLKEIEAIHKNCDVEIESFCHGALCMCYSGQCLMSSLIGGRSGNRGKCAQPCRLSYDAFDDCGKKLNSEGGFILSPKDFCTITSLPKMAEAGVYSFKIEGRMKQMAYASGVTKIYREAMDLYLDGKWDNDYVEKQLVPRLMSLGNRSGFTDSYLYKHNDKSMITMKKPAHEKSEVSEGLIEPKKIKVDGYFNGQIGETATFTVVFEDKSFTVEGVEILPAQNKPVTANDITEKLQKTGGTLFEFENLEVFMSDNSFLPISVVNSMRREALEGLSLEIQRNHGIEVLPEEKPLEKKANPTKKQLLFTFSKEEQINAFLNNSICADIAVEKNLFNACKETIEEIKDKKNSKVYILMPAIIRDDKEFILKDLDYFDGAIATGYDCLTFFNDINYPKDRIILDSRLYTYSNQSIEAFEELGYKEFTSPYELNEKELLHRYNNNSYITIYGYTPVMVTANCIYNSTKGCNKQNLGGSLVDDKNNRFYVKTNCESCYNTIYNSSRLYLIDKLNALKPMNFMGYRADFTIEDSKECERVFKDINEALIEGKAIGAPSGITRGHFNRGVN